MDQLSVTWAELSVTQFMGKQDTQSWCKLLKNSAIAFSLIGFSVMRPSPQKALVPKPPGGSTGLCPCL